MWRSEGYRTCTCIPQCQQFMETQKCQWCTWDLLLTDDIKWMVASAAASHAVWEIPCHIQRHQGNHQKLDVTPAFALTVPISAFCGPLPVSSIKDTHWQGKCRYHFPEKMCKTKKRKEKKRLLKKRKKKRQTLRFGSNACYISVVIVGAVMSRTTAADTGFAQLTVWGGTNFTV